jgi:hypothetical protein
VEKICADEDYRARTLSELAKYCRKERAKILGDAAKKLSTFRASERKSRKKYGIWSPGQRMARKAEFLRHAQSLGVNADALFRLNAYVRKRAALLMDDSTRASSLALAPDPPGDSFDRNCVEFTHPFDVLGRFSTSAQALAGESEVLTSENFLDPPTDVTGGAVRIRNWDADDSDSSWAQQENGFLSCYSTENPASLIKITARFQWVETEIDVDTENEWGWSDCWIRADSWARFAVFLAERGDLGIESVPLQWWHYQGNGDDPADPELGEGPFLAPFISRTAHVGSVWTVSSIFPEVVPGGTLVGIYVGTLHRVGFWVNDVSVDAVSHGKLQLLDFQVCQT